MLLNIRELKFLKNYRNVYGKSSAKREYRDENVFNHFFKSRSSDIVLLKLGNLHQNAKRYEARNTERAADFFFYCKVQILQDII